MFNQLPTPVAKHVLGALELGKDPNVKSPGGLKTDVTRPKDSNLDNHSGLMQGNGTKGEKHHVGHNRPLPLAQVKKLRQEESGSVPAPELPLGQGAAMLGLKGVLAPNRCRNGI